MTTEVLIVGGGVIGLAIARELAGAGIGPVRVVERLGAPGQASSARANGGVRAQFTTRPNIEFSKLTIAEFPKLVAETEGLPGFVRAGYLLLAGTEASEAGLRRGYELQCACGVAVDWLSPAEALERAPFVEPAGLRAATFGREDGILDPHGLVQALFERARALGAEICFDTEVTAIRRAGDGFVVHTGAEEIVARRCVNAAGSDARNVAAMLDVDLPVEPVRRNLACTEPAPGYPEVIPMCVDLDTGVLIRRESGGFLIAYSNPADPPGRDTRVDPAFLDDLAERVGNRFGFLETLAISEQKCWAGLYPETPDHHAVVGEAPGVPGLFLCAGFGGHGLMHALAAARAIRELVEDGACHSLDLRPLRLERFAEGDLIVETAVL